MSIKHFQAISTINRLRDIVFSLVGILTLLPILPLIAFLIKFDSKGPVFYLAKRVGKNMKIFKMYKFRTMMELPYKIGESVCAQYDPRVTAFGRFLRRTKINELPQLLNVLKGDMTLVGPRPEAPDLASLYSLEAKRIFTVKPGLVGPASIRGRNEEECYPPGVDTKIFYLESILPGKLEYDLNYIDNRSFFKDAYFLICAVKETIFGTISKKHINDNRSKFFLMLVDIILIVLSFTSVFLLMHLKHGIYYIPENNVFENFFVLLFIFIIFRFLFNLVFDCYSYLIQYVSYDDIKRVFKSCVWGSLMIFSVFYILEFYRFAIPLIIFEFFFSILLLSAARLSLKFIWYTKNNTNQKRNKKRVLIYGACDEGYYISKLITSEDFSPYKLIGFLDDSSDKYGKLINGKKVLGNRYHLKDLIKLYQIQAVFIAEPNIKKFILNELFDICHEKGLEIKFVNSIDDNNLYSVMDIASRNIEFSDLLSKDIKKFNYSSLTEVLAGKTLLLFGTAGSLGLEVCTHLLRIGCKKLIIVDRYESYLNEIVSNLAIEFSSNKILPYLFDPSEILKLDRLFANNKPDIVIHAGLRKYNSLYTTNFSYALRINYNQTFHLAKISKKYKINNFILLSSILENIESNPLRDSLLVSETCLKHLFDTTNTKFHILRFSDIIENRGGIVSVIKKQILSQKKVILHASLNNGPILLTSKYFATPFILKFLKKVLNNNTNGVEYKCESVIPMDVNVLSTKIALFYGIDNWNAITVEFSNNLPYYGKIIDRRKNTILNSPILNENSYKNTDRNQYIKNVFLEFINNETKVDKKYYTRTNDLLELC